MKKSDLKTGMMVEYNNGKYGIVLKSVETMTYGVQDLFIANENGFMTGSAYDENLICRGNANSSYTILKVYSSAGENNMLRLTLEGRTLLWEREPKPVEMTLEEACKKLRDTMGKPVKITI